MQIAAYKFYFYRHRLAGALPYARACLAEPQRRVQLPADWRDVQPADAAFATLEPQPRLFLFALTAIGTVLARLGRTDEARAALGKVAMLNPADRTGRGACWRWSSAAARTRTPDPTPPAAVNTLFIFAR